MNGPSFKILPDTSMQLVSKLKNDVNPPTPNINKLMWIDIDYKNEKSLFYSTNFDTSKVNVDTLFKNTNSTTFYNPIGKVGPFKISHSYSLGVTDPKDAQGPIDIGPNIEMRGIALSGALMKKLDVKDGDVIYFWVDYK